MRGRGSQVQKEHPSFYPTAAPHPQAGWRRDPPRAALHGYIPKPKIPRTCLISQREGRCKLTSLVREVAFAPGAIQMRTKDEVTEGEGTKRNMSKLNLKKEEEGSKERWCKHNWAA